MKNDQFTIRPGVISDLEKIVELEKRNCPAAKSEAPFYHKLGFNRISEHSPYKDTKMAGFEKKA